jgi:hypothetical protein
VGKDLIEFLEEENSEIVITDYQNSFPHHTKSLLALDLSEPLVKEILSVFEIFQLSKESSSKPSGVIECQSNLTEIEALSKKLHKKLKKLSSLERQILMRSGMRDIYEVTKHVARLSTSCNVAKSKKVKGYFSKKEPFIKQLAIELKEVLERHAITVKLYRRNIFCKALDILLEQPEDSEKSYNLLRQIIPAKYSSLK